MIKLNKYLLRSVFTIAIATLFGASALFLNTQSASMQSGSNTIAFERNDPAAGYTKIFTMNADGTNEVDLGRGFGPSWSPDGSRIAFATGTSETSDIWIMNADGTGRQQITQNWNSYGPAWSPDGSRIAFVSYHEGTEHVYLVNVDGSGQQRLTHNAVGVSREYAPAWSADGSGIIFLGFKVINGLSRYDYYQASASNNGDTLPITALNNLFDIVPAAVSPDGSKIIVEYQHDLQTVTTDGSGFMVNLTPGGTQGLLSDPDYAPNGTKIVYTDGPAIWVMDADGSNAASLGVNGSHPDWNPTAILPGPTPTPTPTATPTPAPPTPTPTPISTPTPAVAVDIAVQASASASSVPVGSQVTYTAVVSNIGSSNSSNAVMVSSPLTSLTPISVQSTVGTCVFANGGIICTIGALNAGASATVTFVGRVTVAGPVSLQFSGGSVEADANQANNTAAVNVTGTSGPCAQPVQVSIEVFGGYWVRDNRLKIDTMVMAIRNRSNQTVRGPLMFVYDNLPANVQIHSSVVSGHTQCAAPINSPYIVRNVGSNGWKPGEVVWIVVPFVNPSRGGIPYNWRLLTGPNNP